MRNECRIPQTAIHIIVKAILFSLGLMSSYTEISPLEYTLTNRYRICLWASLEANENGWTRIGCGLTNSFVGHSSMRVRH